MNDNIDKIINQVVANVEIEGGKIDDKIKVKLKEFLQGKITHDEYINYIKQKHNLPSQDRS